MQSFVNQFTKLQNKHREKHVVIIIEIFNSITLHFEGYKSYNAWLQMQKKLFNSNKTFYSISKEVTFVKDIAQDKDANKNLESKWL